MISTRDAGLHAVWWLTDFADQSVILPVSCLILAWLLLVRWWRGALAWALLVAGVLGTMLVLKLLVGACDWEWPALHLNSPSGHTASAAMLYGGLATVVMRSPSRWRLGLFALAIAVTAAATRLVLGVHTLAEVLLSGLIGTGAILLFAWARGAAPPGLRRGGLLLAVLVVALLAHGHRMRVEQKVHSFAAERLRALICPIEMDGLSVPERAAARRARSGAA